MDNTATANLIHFKNDLTHNENHVKIRTELCQSKCSKDQCFAWIKDPWETELILESCVK